MGDTIYSKCCNVPTKVGGKGMTHWLICPKCNQACDGLAGPRLPTITEMSGLVPDMTEGMSLKEYMERISDG